MKRMLVSVLVFSGLLLLTLDGGSAQSARNADTSSPVSSEDMESFRQSVRAYWDATVKEDWSAIYDFLSTKARGDGGKAEYMENAPKKENMRILSCELGDVEISGRLGWVYTTLAFKYAVAMWDKPRTLKRWQVWEKVDDRWYVLGESEAPSRPPSERALPDEMQLAMRVDEFWKARESGQTMAVYELCDPQFKKRVSPEQFMGKKDLMAYVSHSLNWVEASDGVGRVKVTCEYRYADPNMSKMDPETKIILENWVKVNGVWYREVKTN